MSRQMSGGSFWDVLFKKAQQMSTKCFWLFVFFAVLIPRGQAALIASYQTRSVALAMNLIIALIENQALADKS